MDVTNAAIETAKHVIAQVNRNMPRVHGNGIIHVSAIDAMVECNDPIFEIVPSDPSPIELKIGNFIAELVEDGATLQTGIGGVPDAALRALRGHKDLGLHTEMFSDGVMELVECGALTGRNKFKQWGKMVAGFCIGSRALYDFVDDNPLIEMRDISYVNDTSIIRTNPKVTAINSALEVDITGQVCADSLGQYPVLGRGWADRFYPRRSPLQGWQAHHRAQLSDQPGPVQDRLPAQARCQRHHQQGPCALCGY